MVSVKDVDTAKELVTDVVNATKEGGFRLTKFTSNSREVMEAIPTEDHSQITTSRNLESKEAVERALGMKWNIEDDSFGYSTQLERKPFTRRGLLSTVSSLFDPLGFLSPVILPAKILLQALCKMENLKWDEEVPDKYRLDWEKWLEDLHDLDHLKVNRCIKPCDFGDVTSSELHLFTDGSQRGYGVAAYIRLTNMKGRVHISLLVGKSRVAPTKSISIPKMELTAATVGVNVAQHLLRELDLQIDSVTYHTDSTTVLHYIRNTTKRFPVFIANRLSVIHTYTKPCQWRYVNTTDNAADIASRGATVAQLTNDSMWFHGPSFLYEDKSKWPQEPQVDKEQVEVNVLAMEVKQQEATDQLLNYYSSFYRLKRAVAIYGRFFKFLKDKEVNKGQISLEEIQRAEESVIQYTQKQHFPDEVKLLKGNLDERGKVQKKKSTIFKLDPFMDSESLIIRVGGRIGDANVSQNIRHPILLPKKSHITTLIIREIHERMLHAGRNHILAAVRERYWVINGNTAVRNVISKCVTCKKLRAPPLQQKMADLPAARLNPEAPFTHSAVDLFGPYIIKDGRKEKKKYGALFSCLTSRAIHIEIVPSLETETFINALRRFMARRGEVKTIRCDNATNFHGSEKELRKSMDELDQNAINSCLLPKNIKWIFHSPAASHFGGHYERMIRTVRKALAPMLMEYGTRLNDDCFSTLMCEVESIVNSRPLTTVSDHVDDLHPLSPSQILTAKYCLGGPPPGKFVRDDIFMRKKWRAVQAMANEFWSRWRKEYLVTLQERQKWHAPRDNVKVDDIVLIKDDLQPRMSWNLGRVISVEFGPDKRVRSAFLKTKDQNSLQRPIHKLVKLM